MMRRQQQQQQQQVPEKKEETSSSASKKHANNRGIETNNNNNNDDHLVDSDDYEENNSDDIDEEDDDSIAAMNNPFLGQDQVSYPLTLTSSILFLLSSTLYLYLSTIGMEYQQEIQHFTDDMLLADDSTTWHNNGYADDYIWVTPIRQVVVSEYTVVYTLAALGFVISGCVDWYQWQTWYSVLMIAAAVFGLASALYTDTNPHRSIWLNSCSLHLWALDAIAVLIWFNRGSYGNNVTLQWSLCLADVTFVIGTAIGLTLSWYYLIREPIRSGVMIAWIEIFAALCWLVTATLYLISTIFLGRQAAAVKRKKKSIIPPLHNMMNSKDDDDEIGSGSVTVSDPESGPVGSLSSSSPSPAATSGQRCDHRKGSKHNNKKNDDFHRNVTIVYSTTTDDHQNDNDDDAASIYNDGLENIEMCR